MFQLRRRCDWLCVQAFFLLMMGGCSAMEPTNGKEGLNSKQLETTLKSADVKDMDGLFNVLSDLSLNEPQREAFKTGKTKNDTVYTFDNYLESFYLQEADRQAAEREGRDFSRDSVLASLGKQIEWKKKSASVGDIKKVYVLSAKQSSKAEELASWGKLVYFDVFADENEGLLGWFRVSDERK